LSAALLGIDIGTSATKAVLAAPSGQVLAGYSVPHGTDLPAAGHAEQDAERVWWADTARLCREAAAGHDAGLAGITVSGLGPCLVPCDADLTPLRPGILYGIDSRAGEQIAAITRQLGAAEILRRGGSALSSQAVGPKLAWLREHEPRTWARTRYVHTAHSFVTQRLTGEYVLDQHSASQFDPLYDMRAGAWNPEWCELIAGGMELPRLLWPGELAGHVTPEAAAATGLPAGLPVVMGTIDAWAEALSAGVSAPGDLMIMYGSTMFLVLCAESPRFDAAVWCTAGVAPGTLTYAAGMATSGSLIRWLCDLTGQDFAAADAAAAAVPPGAGGLLCLPYFAGERSPLFDPRARGAFAGLTLGHGAGHLVRAGYEAVAYGVRHNLDVLAGLGATPRRAVAVGGGTAGGLWTQIVSDVTGLAQDVPAVRTGAAYGSALLAARGTGLAGPAAQWAEISATVRPDPARAAAYDAGYRAWRRLGQLLTPVSHDLARQQGSGAQQGSPW
jgi:xylulokinase